MNKQDRERVEEIDTGHWEESGLQACAEGLDKCDKCFLLNLIDKQGKVVEGLAEALQDLLDEQNGPPLLLHEKTWQGAVHEAYKILKELEGEK